MCPLNQRHPHFPVVVFGCFATSCGKMRTGPGSPRPTLASWRSSPTTPGPSALPRASASGRSRPRTGRGTPTPAPTRPNGMGGSRTGPASGGRSSPAIATGQTWTRSRGSASSVGSRPMMVAMPSTDERLDRIEDVIASLSAIIQLRSGAFDADVDGTVRVHGREVYNFVLAVQEERDARPYVRSPRRRGRPRVRAPVRQSACDRPFPNRHRTSNIATLCEAQVSQEWLRSAIERPSCRRSGTSRSGGSCCILLLAEEGDPVPTIYAR